MLANFYKNTWNSITEDIALHSRLFTTRNLTLSFAFTRAQKEALPSVPHTDPGKEFVYCNCAGSPDSAVSSTIKYEEKCPSRKIRCRKDAYSICQELS
jgi:hypothetical protein